MYIELYVYERGETMFRECYFDYAGVSSQSYNLIFCYVGTATDSFDSGGKFELKTDTLPRSHETLLYGKDYSAEPLNFEVEIINPDEAIPYEQMIEIKDWLFGQDGWKTLTIRDERQNYCLKCIFEPEEDIADGMGYRGLRCKLHNVSPFWYGEEQEITITNEEIIANQITSDSRTFSVQSVFIPDDACVGNYVYPICEVTSSRTSTPASADYTYIVSRVKAETIAEGQALNNAHKFIYGNESVVSFKTDGLTTGDYLFSIDTKYATIRVNDEIISSVAPQSSTGIVPVLRLRRGNNIIRFSTSNGEVTQIKFKYTPVYRMGAF